MSRGTVVPHSPENWRFSALNGNDWHESPGFLLVVGSIPARGTKGPLTCVFTVSAGCTNGSNHVLLTFLNEKLLTFLAFTGPVKTPVDVTFFNYWAGNPRKSAVFPIRYDVKP